MVGDATIKSSARQRWRVKKLVTFLGIKKWEDAKRDAGIEHDVAGILGDCSASIITLLVRTVKH